MPDNKKVCPFCGGEMALQHRGWLGLRENKLVSLTEEFVEAELYRCPDCRYLAWFQPLTAVEQFEKEQQTLESQHDPVKKFEILFADYPAKKLQKVIDGRDYLPEAKEAARNLLRKRGE